ncbi:hypothetical protein K8I28_06300 [bacterium]|nr:hypothetical protein [bacterium]
MYSPRFRNSIIYKEQFHLSESYYLVMNSYKVKILFIPLFLLSLLSAQVAISGVELHQVTSIDLTEYPDLNKVQIEAVDFAVDGTFYLLDSRHKTVIHLDALGNVMEKVGGFGSGGVNLLQPLDISVSGFEVWVCDPMLGSIQRFDRRLVTLGTIPLSRRNLENNEVTQPISSCRLPNSDLVLIDRERGSLMLLDQNGVLTDQVDTYGLQNQRFITPIKVDCSSNGNLFVIDSKASQIVSFDSFGTFRKAVKWDQSKGDLKCLASDNRGVWVGSSSHILQLDEKLALLGEWDSTTFQIQIQDIATQGKQLAISSQNRIIIFEIKDNK